jgi:methionyl-tRNA formyltransferase
MNIVLIAEESAGIQALATLSDTNHCIVAVLASPMKSRVPRASVFLAAKKCGLPVWPAELVKDASFAERLRAERVDLILNVHSLYLIHDEVLRAPLIGAFNLHPGPLPRYAGLNAVSWAIYRGETFYGVTLHKMVPEIDAGPIVYQTLFPMSSDESALSLSTKCVEHGLELLRRLLDVAAENPSRIPLAPQNFSERNYYGKSVPHNGCLSWDWPAHRIVNFVRACDYFPFRSPWGYPSTEWAHGSLSIMKASRTGTICREVPGTVGEVTGPAALIASSDEWVEVQKVRFGKVSMPPGNVFRTGDRLSAGIPLAGI